MGASGAWRLNHNSLEALKEDCVAHCYRCARCNYVSLSLERHECGWFNRCPALRRTPGLAQEPRGFLTAPVVDTKIKLLPQLLQRLPCSVQLLSAQWEATLTASTPPTYARAEPCWVPAVGAAALKPVNWSHSVYLATVSNHTPPQLHSLAAALC